MTARARHTLADAASLLVRRVEKGRMDRGDGRHARERLHDDAFHLADALAGARPARVPGVQTPYRRV